MEGIFPMVKALVICLLVILLAFAAGKHERQLEDSVHSVFAVGFVFLLLREQDLDEVWDRLGGKPDPLDPDPHTGRNH